MPRQLGADEALLESRFSFPSVSQANFEAAGRLFASVSLALWPSVTRLPRKPSCAGKNRSDRQPRSWVLLRSLCCGSTQQLEPQQWRHIFHLGIGDVGWGFNVTSAAPYSSNIFMMTKNLDANW